MEQQLPLAVTPYSLVTFIKDATSILHGKSEPIWQKG